MRKTNKLALLIAFTIFLGCPLVEKPNNIKPSSRPTPVITTTPSPSASILDTQMSSNIKLEKFDGKLVFLSNKTPKDLEANSLYFLDGDKPIPKKIFTFSTNSNLNRFLISPDEKKVFILNVPLNQVDNTALSSNNLDLYIFDLENNKLNKITLDKDLTFGNLSRISWFPNSRFLAIKDESNTTYVFDTKENKILVEHQITLEKNLIGSFIISNELNNNFIYFLASNGYSNSYLWKIYPDTESPKFYNFTGYYFFNTITNNSLLIHDRFDYDKLRSIDINSSEVTNILNYDNFKELNETYRNSTLFHRSSLSFIRNKIKYTEIIIIAGFHPSFDCCPESFQKVFLFDLISNKLTFLSMTYPYASNNGTIMVSKSQVYIGGEILDIYTREKNESLSNFFHNNLSYLSISSIYSN